MSKSEVSRLLALIIVFCILFTLDTISSSVIATYLSKIFKPLVDLSIKSRIAATKITEGIKIAYGRNIFEHVQLDGVLSLTKANVLGVRDNYLIVAAPSKPGDVAIDPESKKIVGITKESNGQISWVESIFSPNIPIPVLVRSKEVSLDGELIEGSKLRIYEEIDVTGFEVLVSDAFTCGTALKNLGYGYIGTVEGARGRYFLVDNFFTIPDSVLFLPGY